MYLVYFWRKKNLFEKNYLFGPIFCLEILHVPSLLPSWTIRMLNCTEKCYLKLYQKQDFRTDFFCKLRIFPSFETTFYLLLYIHDLRCNFLKLHCPIKLNVLFDQNSILKKNCSNLEMKWDDTYRRQQTSQSQM